jgi:hypothetical protein
MGLGSSKLTVNEKAVCNSAVAHHRSLKRELNRLPKTETFNENKELEYNTNSVLSENIEKRRLATAPTTRYSVLRKRGFNTPRVSGGKRKTRRNRRRS